MTQLFEIQHGNGDFLADGGLRRVCRKEEDLYDDFLYLCKTNQAKEGSIMATMELSAMQAQIAREVLNIEDAELLKKIQRSIKRLCSKAKAEAEEEYRPATKKEILAGFAEACKEAKLIREGKLKGIPANELIHEL